MATCYYFKLIPETGLPLDIREPINWSKVQVIGKRDPVWHGFNYEYTDGETTLEFACSSGKDFIEAVYNEHGVDGLILLQFGRLSPDGLTEIVEYEGKLNLATFKRLKSYRIACSVEKSGLHDQIKTRWETKVSMNASRSIDEVTITPPTAIDMELHSKLLVNNFTKKTAIEGTTAWTPFLELNAHDMYFTFNTGAEGATNSNIDETLSGMLGPTNNYPLDFKNYVFNIKAGGDFVFNITLDYDYNIKLTRRGVSLGEPKIGDWTMNNYLHVVDKNGILKVRVPFTGADSGFRNGQFLVTPGSKRITATLLNYSINLEVGDEVYIYGHFNFDGFSAGWKGIEAYIRTWGTDWDVTAETSSAPTIAKAFLAHETLEHLLNVVTNDSTALESNFLGREDIGYPSTGCGALNAHTNGFQVRQFDIANKPPQLSLKDFLGSYNALYSIGLGYEANKVRVEKEEYFYQDVEIIFFSDISDYEERVATELIFNNIEIGYNKYLDEGLRILDEFNTRHEYISPIKRHDNKFSQLSVLIASGYALEVTRREVLSETPKDSTKYDDDIFIVAVNSDFVPEKDEPFDIVTNVVSPETSYNLRHSPKRMLLKWAKWLNGGFYYKNPGDQILNTFCKQNGELTTQFDAAETCNLGDPQKDLIREKDNVALAMFDEKNRLFIPEWVSFKTKINKATVELIRDCMTGQNTDGKNYGFIRHALPDGNQCESWLYSMSYNPNSELVSFELLKKRFINVLNPDEFNCLDYADYTFAMFEATPDLSASIEECRFENFN